MRVSQRRLSVECRIAVYFVRQVFGGATRRREGRRMTLSIFAPRALPPSPRRESTVLCCHWRTYFMIIVQRRVYICSAQPLVTAIFFGDKKRTSPHLTATTVLLRVKHCPPRHCQTSIMSTYVYILHVKTRPVITLNHRNYSPFFTGYIRSPMNV